MIDDEDWECPECQYDRAEARAEGHPPPVYCPLCLEDTGRLVRVRRRHDAQRDLG
jgi:rubrerythrin